MVMQRLSLGIIWQMEMENKNINEKIGESAKAEFLTK
jgi:hypothetical protein